MKIMKEFESYAEYMHMHEKFARVSGLLHNGHNGLIIASVLYNLTKDAEMDSITDVTSTM